MKMTRKDASRLDGRIKPMVNMCMDMSGEYERTGDGYEGADISAGLDLVADIGMAATDVAYDATKTETDDFLGGMLDRMEDILKTYRKIEKRGV